MVDTLTPEQRSRVMSRVRGKDTKPEKKVRSLLHAAGYRYRIHRRDLPGVPDIVLPRYHAVVFVHGCFWHGHSGCNRAKMPTTQTDFWKQKIDANRARDRRNIKALENLGYSVVVVWQCDLRFPERVLQTIETALLQGGNHGQTVEKKRSAEIEEGTG